jgi:tRNA uridine 5-carboxymethylaminomethyl modification enzyme
MLPSRAEYRITLREGNADLRLSETGHAIGLLPDKQYDAVRRRRQAIEELLSDLHETRVGPSDPINEQLVARGTPALAHNGASLFDLLRRPGIRLSDLTSIASLHPDIVEEAEIEGRYAGYLLQQEREIRRLRRMEDLYIPDNFDFRGLSNLSIEGRDLLARVQPRSFGQASRVPGVSHADLSMLAIHLRR